MSDSTGAIFLLILLAWIPVILIITGWFLYVLGKRSERRKKKKTLHTELYTAPGVKDLLDEGRDDEAVDIYQKFTGINEYTAQAMVERIKNEMDSE